MDTNLLIFLLYYKRRRPHTTESEGKCMNTMMRAASTSANDCKTHTTCGKLGGRVLYGPAATVVGVVRGRSVGRG